MPNTMRIALYGSGRMGKAIETIAEQRGHTIGLKVDSRNAGTAPLGCDVAIEFSRPEHALDNMRLCLANRVPVVVGTTGWYDKLGEVKAMVRQYQGALLWASNFSIGVNLFFRVNRMLAGLMEKQADYHVRIDETHHIHKLDAPSGTAITLARDIDLKAGRYAGYELKGQGQEQEQEQEQGQVAGSASVPVVIHSERIGEVTGTHTVTWTGPNDRLVMTHEAFDRGGFAMGAVVAAEWIKGRSGLFTMDDVLDEV
ncbi:MAG TPA: 4-hydroxy-tetrahydrodipicolinate reductase [Flavobacteriales bacterium]|nr:4-hydroxy-tetrahydrodipicolinate reductase [Flavobacteriales bacterium]